MSYRHFVVKSAIYEILADAGHEVRTEVEIPDRWIVDVIDLDKAKIYEVETDISSAARKSKVQRYLQAERMGPVIEDIIFFDPKELPKDMVGLKEELEAAVEAADKAGKVIDNYVENGFQDSKKSDGSFVTEAEKAMKNGELPIGAAVVSGAF